jgi:hypothetical protein
VKVWKALKVAGKLTKNAESFTVNGDVTEVLSPLRKIEPAVRFVSVPVNATVWPAVVVSNGEANENVMESA